MRSPHPALMGRQSGFLMVPVVLLLLTVALAAFLLNRQGTDNVTRVGGETETAEAQFVAEAGYQHALWQARQAGCTSYAGLTNEPFGAHTYTAAVAPSSDSPITIKSTAVLASGTRGNFDRTPVQIHDFTAPMTMVLEPGPEGKDTFIEGESGHRNHNKGDHNELKTSSETGKEYRALIEFDLSALPRTALVDSAVLDLEVQSFNSSDVVQAHRLLRDWTESGATWNDYNGVSAWNTPGGDYDPDIAGSFLVDSTGLKSMDITGLTRSWVDSTVANHGLILLSPPSPTGDENKYHSSDKGGEQHPRLTITYFCECGQPCGGVGRDPIILSTDSAATLGGLSFTDRDLAEYDPLPDTATLFFDGGPTTLASDIDAVHVLGNGHIVLSTTGAATLGGLSFQDEDLVEYDPLLDSATLYFDGSAHFAANEDIISVHVLDNGNLILSTDSNAELGGVPFSDNDLVEYDPVAMTASIYFDGDATTLSEDITAVHLLDNGDLVLAAKNATTLGGLSFTAADLIQYDRVADTAMLYLDGTMRFSDPSEKIISVHVNEPFPAANLLFVAVDPANLTVQELAKKSLIESWGYTVALIDVHDPQTSFDAAVAVNDVVYITEDVASGDLNTKLVNATIGVVTEEDNLSDEFGLSQGIAWESGTSLEINDNTHYITTPFALGLLTIMSATENLSYVTGTQAPALGRLGSSTSGFALVTLDAGAAMYSGGFAAGRRAQLPWGGNDFDLANLNADGRTIMRRALEWGAGAGTGGTGPIAHWKLDEGGGPSALDTEGGNDATLNGGPTWTTGTLDGALEFDGSGDYAITDSNFTPPPVGTVAFWMQVSGPPASHGRILGLDDTWEIRHVTTGTTNGIPYGLVFDLGVSGTNNDFVTTTTVDVPGRWYHIAASYDTTNDAYAVYIDGVLHKNGIYPSSLTVPPANLLSLGTRTGSTQYFDGVLDDVRVYDRFLSASEIADLAGATPFAHWKLDDGTGATAMDSVGINDGTLINGPTWVAGQIGDALNFDGVNDRVDVGTFDVSGSGLTMLGWFNADTIPTSDPRIISKANSSAVAGAWWQLSTTDSGANRYLRMRIKASGTTTTFQDTTVNLNPGQWYFAAATYDAATGAMKLYLDGVEIASGSHSVGGPVDADPSVPVAIGANGTAERFFDGILDDVRVYNRALSPSQIADLAAQGGGGGSPPMIFEVRVAAGNDDAEERVSNGNVNLTSSDLELIADGANNQYVGMRFTNVTVPNGATISNAYVQFQADETNSGATNVNIQGQDIDDAPTFTSTNSDISSRSLTTASVPWAPAPWTTIGAHGPDQRTPDISAVIQEIVNRPGWSSGNDIVIVITGSGERTAESYNGVAAAAPLLHIEY